MPLSSNQGNDETTRNPTPSGIPRIQISLSKENHTNMVTASSVTRPERTSGTTTQSGNNESNSDTIKATIPSVVTSKPVLYKSVRKALKNQTLNFKINTECTSLKVSPSGNFLWGGFSDGTLRVWDLSGTFGVEDDDVIASRQKTDVMVNSKLTQGYGAVACQIHARGVHTDLITTVDVSDDAQYVFMGVARGAMELNAVYVGDLERAVHTHKHLEKEGLQPHKKRSKRNILDYLKVYFYSDAKLKGLGACATMKVDEASGQRQYLLLTGKGIKNIHIWRFTPPEHPCSDNSESSDGNEHPKRKRQISICEHPDEDNGSWDQLYDTSTNGNSINLLGFYRNPQNKLLAVSKSDSQKLRLWDLSFEEEHPSAADAESDQRPKRPPYKDVENSRSALEIAGGIGVCGGGSMYNEMSIVSLDRPDDPYNHTELALPSAAASDPGMLYLAPSYSSRRQRRGEMKAVVTVATSPRDSSHALLELDDGSLVGYSAGSGSSKDPSSGSIPRLANATPESTGIPALPADFWRRCICLDNIAGVVIAASSVYNPNTNKGQLVIRALGGLKKPRGGDVNEKKNKLRLLKKEQKQKERMEREQQRLERERLEQEQVEQQKKREKLKLERQRERDQMMLLLKQQQQKDGEQQSKKRHVVPPPMTPSPTHANPPSSPEAADAQALRDAVSVPLSEQRSNNTTPEGAKGQQFNVPSITTTASQSTSSSASLTRVSPSSNTDTPRNENFTPSCQDDSPESTQGLPKISKFLLPKRIDMQPAEIPEKQKKRKAHQQPKETETSKTATPTSTTISILQKESKAIKKARIESALTGPAAIKTTPNATKYPTEKATVTASNTSVPPVSMVQLKDIGSVPFKSPKPQPVALKKKLVVPPKPKKLNFSTPKASRDATKMGSKIKSETCAIPSTRPSVTPIAKAPSAAGERKRDRTAFENEYPAFTPEKGPRTNEEVSTAMVLTTLSSSPQPIAKEARPKPSDESFMNTVKTTNTTNKPKAGVTVTPKVPLVVSQSKATSIRDTPKPKAHVDSRMTNAKVTPVALKSNPPTALKKPPPAAPKKSLGSVPKSKGKTTTSFSPSREELLREKISEQYNQLRAFLKGITERSMALIHSRNSKGPVPSALAPSAAKRNKAHIDAYSKLLAEHRATHDYLQKRLLLSAETTLRLLMESRITADGARSELKQSMKKFEEILCDTLYRQEQERLAVVSQHYMAPSNFALGRRLSGSGNNDRPPEATKGHSDYPCKEAFDKVEDICAIISRPVGRPRSALANLR